MIALAVAAAAGSSRAAVFRIPRSRGNSSITLRKRLHVNTLITEPGTAEFDWSSLYSLSTTNFAMPAAIKYTPRGTQIAWGRTEYSVSFDMLDITATPDGRVSDFSQAVTVTATSVLHDGERLDIAIAPQATFLLRGDSGVRLGVIAIARYDVGRNSIGGTFSWSGATHPSDTNPAGTFDIGTGFGRRLAAGGTLGKFTPHVNAVWERSTGIAAFTSFYEGVEFQATERLAFDVSGQHLSATRGVADHQVVFGMTVNFGHP
jgi:hypothetical protein